MMLNWSLDHQCLYLPYEPASRDMILILPMELVATLLVYASRLSNQTAGFENLSMKKCLNTGLNLAQIS